MLQQPTQTPTYLHYGGLAEQGRFPKFCKKYTQRKMNSPLYNLFCYVNEFDNAFIESNSSRCIIFWGQDFQNKFPCIDRIIAAVTRKNSRVKMFFTGGSYIEPTITYHLWWLIFRTASTNYFYSHKGWTASRNYFWTAIDFIICSSVLGTRFSEQIPIGPTVNIYITSSTPNWI